MEDDIEPSSSAHRLKNTGSNSHQSQQPRSNKKGFLSSLKKDWRMLLKGFTLGKKPAHGDLYTWTGSLADLGFAESDLKSLDVRLSQLSSAKRTLNHRIERIQKQLELLEVTLKDEFTPEAKANLIAEGEAASRELQSIEVEINQLRRFQKSRAKGLSSPA